jgi:glutamate--cysteine ligase
LLYDDDAAEEAWSLFSSLDFDARMARWHLAVKEGMHAGPVHENAKRLLSISRTALETLDIRDSRDRTEARFLDPLEALVEQGRSPADLALEALGDSPGRGPEARIAFAEHFVFAG